MFWPILECSAVAAGLWIARFFVPVALALPADVASLTIICTMFVWLTRRALRRGEQRGAVYGAARAVSRYRARQATPDHTQASDPAYSENGQVRQ